MTLCRSWKSGACAAIALAAALLAAGAAQKTDQASSATVQFSVPSGVYTNDLRVRLTASGAGAVIHYTLDGSEPTEAAPRFSQPVAISTSTLLKAKAFTPGLSPGPTVSQSYMLLDEDLFSFSSNLPLVILNTFGGYVSTETKTPLSVIFVNPAGERCSLSGRTDFNGRGTIHLRGRSSMEYRKKSFTLHLTDDAGAPLKVPLLGLPKESTWILYGPYPDKPMMRDALAYELSRKMGHYAPRTKFVELFVSRSGTKISRRSYVGVYVLVEKIKRGKSRVDIARLGPEDDREPAISGGYIFKKDHSDKGKPGFVTRQGNAFFYVEPKPEEVTSAQKAWLSRYLNQFENVLYGASFKDPARGYAAYIDVDSFVDQHWIVELTKNVDGIRFSNFLHKDRGGKIKMEPIWDWNLSFGNANGKEGWMPEGWYSPQLSDGEYLWFGRLFEDPEFEQRYIDRWGVLRTNIFAASNLLSRVDELAALLDESQARNFKRWPILGRYVNPNWYVGNSYPEEVEWMKQWIRRRVAWIDQQFVAAPAPILKNQSGETDRSLALRAPAGKIYYTLDGTDPRAPGGAVSSQARLYDAPIPLKGPSRIYARARTGNRWSYPFQWTGDKAR